MFKNYLKIAARSLIKNKVYSLINISGLAAGIACCLIIFLYVQDELGYDKFHKNSKNIYRVLSAEPGKPISARTPFRLGPTLQQEFPEINRTARITWPWPEVVSYEDKNFNQNVICTDSTFFEVFSFALIKGNPREVLNKPNHVVITEEAARKYFGAEDPIGKTVLFNREHEFVVGGIVENVPRHSHFQFDMLAPIPFMRNKFGSALDQWDFEEFFTYLLLSEKSSRSDLENKFSGFIEKHIGQERPAGLMFPLQPLHHIRLYSSHLAWDITVHGDIAYIYTFSAIAIFVLLIASVNYMNLSTARSTKRAKEVGLRKVVGANRRQLVRQFLGESLLLAFLSLILAIGLVEILLPLFNNILGKSLAIRYSQNLPFLSGLVITTILVGVISGSFPAFFLSAFRPAEVLKSKLKSDKTAILRKGLVTLQFTISISLIVCSIAVYRQLHFLKTKDLEFDKEHLIVANMPDSENERSTYLALKNDLLQHPDITGVSAASSVPPHKYHYTGAHAADDSNKTSLTMKFFAVDHNFIETLEMKMVSGRTFSADYATDEKGAIVINEAAVRELGWETPVGKRLKVNWNDRVGTVIGVVKDFHFKSLHDKIEPTVFTVDFNQLWQIVVRIRPQNIPNTLNDIKLQWKKYDPVTPFDFSFVDQNFAQQYRAEQKMGSALGYFTFLAILIACLGIFGLASFSAENRTKEIGIRKILGASVAGIVNLLSKDFVKNVLLANCIAWPLAYFAMNKWLENFAYRIDVGWPMFALAGGAALLIALLTVSTQAIKAALANPVEALRYE
ncbi:ABC transporter permease [candidate division KSB1 bacterium]|nr:ABC transporter permease [candidate division KSB1 bacterium]